MPQEIVELMNTPEERRAHTLETGFMALSLLYGPPDVRWRMWTGYPWEVPDDIKDAIIKCFNTYQVVFFSPGKIARDYAIWYTQQEEKNNA